MEIFLLFLAAISAAVINALAGGGGLITFTVLMLLVPPAIADATSAVALVTGYPAAVWRTRSELTGAIRERWLWLLLITCVLGGLSGALLLKWSGDRNFVEAVPWLVLVATLLILLRPIVVGRGNSDRLKPSFAPWLWPVAIAVTFIVAIYGGFFGAGIGILMISVLSFMGIGDIHRAVAVKNLLTGCMRGVAALVLVAEGDVDWAYALPMAVGGLIGGYLGGLVSHKANQSFVRWMVIGIGFTVAAYYFWKLYASPVLQVGGGH